MSLFLHNLHESVRYDVTMYSRNNDLTMQEIRKHTQLAWETLVRPARWTDGEARVLGIQATEQGNLALEGDEMPRAKSNTKRGFRERQPPRPQRDQQNKGGGGCRITFNQKIRFTLNMTPNKRRNSEVSSQTLPEGRWRGRKWRS